MKILEIDKRHGYVKVRVEYDDDLWILSMVIAPGDIVSALTTRDVRLGQEKRRIPMRLAIKVEKLEFQPFTGRLRIHGVIIEGPDEYGLTGSHHTLSIDIGSEVEIVKKEWPKPLLKKLTETTKRSLKIIAIAIDFDEYAIALIQEQGVKRIIERSMNLPGGKSETWDLKLKERIEEITDLALEILDREQAQGVIIASPGFIKDMIFKAITRKRKNLKIFTDTVSIGGFTGIMELLRRDKMKEVMKHLSAIEAEEILAEFHRLLAHNPSKITYGISSIEVAAKAGAIEILLVLDTFLRENPEIRMRIEKIMSDVDSKGGKVRIVSIETPAGQQLKMLGGLVAILRYSFSYTQE